MSSILTPEVEANGPSPAPSFFLEAPPPSLVTTPNPTRYGRGDLLALQTPHALPPAPERLASFSLFRHDSGQWGVPEDNSTLLDKDNTLDGEPIAKSLPIPHFDETPAIHPCDRKDSYSTSEADTVDVLFDYRAFPKPVLIDFTNPNPFGTPRKASEMFQVMPGSNSSSDTLVGGNSMAMSLGEKFSTLRLGARTNSVTRSGSYDRSSSPTLSTSSRGSRYSIAEAPLNPFAAPWPLPGTTRKIPVNNHNIVPDPMPTYEITLPLPKNLPASLPPKPNAPLPPVFIKRETAALPQPMALPDIAPLGRAWEGENSLSGNDRRRRASEMGLPPLPLTLAGGQLGGKGSGGSMVEKRPEMLVKLGEKLRMSMTEQGRRSGKAL